MSMIKVISPSSQDFSEPVSSLIKISSRGLIGSDKFDLVKRAGAEFVDKISNIKFDKDEIPVHMIAIGATEDYGPNRNGDGFKRACCDKYHDTFVKFAKFYRDHQNKNPAKSYGVVKASTYHQPMKRIELVVALNGSKEAAEKNGGLLADREMEKLARGDDMGVSMACTIGYDVCSSCGNKARTRAEYCDSIENGGHCKAGGLRHKIGCVLENGHVLHADNPHPRFFDISHVFRPADRIAYVSGRLKAASAGIVSGAELAEQLGVTLPAYAVDSGGFKAAQMQLYALEKLVEAETFVNKNANSRQMALASAQEVQPNIDFAPCTHVKLSEVLKGLADANVVLPLRDFLALTVKNASNDTVDAVRAELQNIFSKLSVETDICTQLENNVYLPAPVTSGAIKLWAEKVATTHSIKAREIEKRAFLAALKDIQTPDITTNEKRANTNNPAAMALARHYAFYKIAAFARICELYDDNGLTASHCVLQNYIS